VIGKSVGKSFGRGRWHVQRERFHLENEIAPHGVTDPAKIADIIPALMKGLGLGDMHWLNVMQEEWAGIVGEAVAKHTRPGRMEKKKLTVFVDSSVWLNELLRYGRKEMLVNLQKRFGRGKVDMVNLVLDPDGLSRG